jgi:two-component system CheB/CheR fusion protein
MFAALLRLLGHQVFVAATAAEGVAAFRQHQLDFAFIDIGLPDQDGYAVVRELRKEPGADAVCLVALTGYAQPEDQRRAREAGFDLHLAKPVVLEQVEKVLAHEPAKAASGGQPAG